MGRKSEGLVETNVSHRNAVRRVCAKLVSTFFCRPRSKTTEMDCRPRAAVDQAVAKPSMSRRTRTDYAQGQDGGVDSERASSDCRTRVSLSTSLLRPGRCRLASEKSVRRARQIGQLGEDTESCGTRGQRGKLGGTHDPNGPAIASVDWRDASVLRGLSVWKRVGLWMLR